MNVARKTLEYVRARLWVGDRSGSLAVLNQVLTPTLRAPLDPEATFFCERLGCAGVAYLTCVARQIQSDNEIRGVGSRATRARRRTRANRSRELARHDGKRGTTPSRPTCVTTRCEFGAAVRAILGDTREAQALASRAPRASDTSEV